MSREWKYVWLRLVLYILLMLSMGTIFSNLGHSLSSVAVRVSVIFVFISFTSLLSISGLPAHTREIKLYTHEQSNRHSGAIVFLLGNLLASIPFLFLISISSSVVFYFLIGLRNEFSLLMYFMLNFFMFLLANEGLVMIVAYIWLNTFSSVLSMVFIHVITMLVAGYFRIRVGLPEPVWKYPLSYVAFHTYSIQGLLENEYIGTSFAVGQVRSITGLQALRDSFSVSSMVNVKWVNLLILLLMAIGYRIIFLFLILFHIRRRIVSCRSYRLNTFVSKARQRHQ